MLLNFTMDNLIDIIILIIISFIGSYIIPLLKNHKCEQKYDELMKWISVAVKAAEITIKKEENGNSIGALKKVYVVDFLQDILIRLDIDVTEAQLDTLIESTVADLKLLLNK